MAANLSSLDALTYVGRSSAVAAPAVPDAPATEASIVSTPSRVRRRRVVQYDDAAHDKTEVNPAAAAAATAATAATASSDVPLWRRQYDGIVAMRAARDAPVDSMGCEQCASDTADDRAKRFQTLVSLMLSSQTKDPVTFAGVARLRDAVGQGMTADAFLSVFDVEGGEDRLAQLLCPVGFYRNKAKFLLSACRSIMSDFGGDIPNTLEGLMSLKGVGPKMAHIAMSSAWGVHVGIGVDTHVHRISNRLGWVRKTKDPEDTRVALQALLPEELWPHVNVLLVGFGQTICTPVRPRCDDCAIRELCPVGTGAQPLTPSRTGTPARSPSASATRDEAAGAAADSPSTTPASAGRKRRRSDAAAPM